jgi:hypothetical protein
LTHDSNLPFQYSVELIGELLQVNLHAFDLANQVIRVLLRRLPAVIINLTNTANTTTLTLNAASRSGMQVS